MSKSRSRSRFATALQQARLSKHWTQEQLVDMLHVKLRTAISWETGERIPSIGMVFLLCMVLGGASATSTEGFTLELLIPYLLDDLERQKEFHPEEAFQEFVAQGIQQLLQVAQSLPQSAQAPAAFSLLPQQPAKRPPPGTGSFPSNQPQMGHREAENTDIEQILTLIERLRNRPDLLPVVNEFLDQMMLV